MSGAGGIRLPRLGAPASPARGCRQGPRRNVFVTEGPCARYTRSAYQRKKKTKRERGSAVPELGGAIGSDQPTASTPHSENVMIDTSTKTAKARPVSFSP